MNSNIFFWHESRFVVVCCKNRDNGPLARYVKLRVVHALGIPGAFSPPLRVRYPDMHQGTCVTHVPWCTPGSLTTQFLWSQCNRAKQQSGEYFWGYRNWTFKTHSADTKCYIHWSPTVPVSVWLPEPTRDRGSKQETLNDDFYHTTSRSAAIFGVQTVISYLVLTLNLWIGLCPMKRSSGVWSFGDVSVTYRSRNAMFRYRTSEVPVPNQKLR